MSLRFYLAMTEAEIRNATTLPRHLAYMACHFSPYGNGLVNIPERLPPNSLLIVNDRVPVLRHDPQQVAKQLLYAAQKLRAYGVLMDLQIPGNPHTAQIVKTVISTLPCPVGVSELYAEGLSCPIFSAPALGQPLAGYIKGKKGRPLWLETFQETTFLTISPTGCRATAGEKLSGKSFFDEALQCKYQFCVQKESALFALSRQEDDIAGYLRSAESLGIEVAVGLYQHFRNISHK